MLRIVVDPAFRGVVLLFNDATVTVVAVQLHCQQRVGEAPADRRGIWRVVLSRDAHERCCFGEPAAFTRRLAVVARRLGVEVREVIVQRGHLARCHDVAAVLELLSRGAVRLHAEEIAQQRPLHHRLNLVERFVGAAELADAFHVGVEPEAFEGVGAWATGESGYLHVAEAVEGEPWCVDLDAVA